MKLYPKKPVIAPEPDFAWYRFILYNRNSDIRIRGLFEWLLVGLFWLAVTAAVSGVVVGFFWLVKLFI